MLVLAASIARVPSGQAMELLSIVNNGSKYIPAPTKLISRINRRGSNRLRDLVLRRFPLGPIVGAGPEKFRSMNLKYRRKSKILKNLSVSRSLKREETHEFTSYRGRRLAD